MVPILDFGIGPSQFLVRLLACDLLLGQVP